MEGKTKQRILEAALEEFAERGYEGAKLTNIAERLGITKSALYKHFESKEHIWESLMAQLEETAEKRFATGELLPPIPKSVQELEALTMQQAEYLLHTKRASLVRKLLSAQQFQDERAARLMTKAYITDDTAVYTFLFQKMMEEGSLKKGNAKIWAMEYAAPISAMVQLADRHPELTDSALARIQAHVEAFLELRLPQALDD